MTVPRVTVTRLADGCQIHIDPLGYRPLILPAIGCSLFVAVGVAIIVWGGRVGVPLLLGLLFSAIPMGIFLSLLVSSSRHFLIEARERRLVVERFGLWSRRSFRWDIDDIQSIMRCDSGASVNNRSLDELLTRTKADPGLKMMVGRERAEIDYVAAQIQRAMPGLRQQSPEK
jgi:hypothetical protein